MKCAEAVFWSYAASYANFKQGTLQFNELGTRSKPVAAYERLRLDFVLLRICPTQSANQSWPAPAPMFVALETTGCAREEPSATVVGGGRLVAHEKFKQCSLLGQHKGCVCVLVFQLRQPHRWTR